MKYLILLALLFLSFSVSAEWVFPEDAQVRCQMVANVGYDTAINARLGVEPEHIAKLSTDLATGELDLYLYSVMAEAYFWKQSPRDYFVIVWNECYNYYSEYRHE